MGHLALGKAHFEDASTRWAESRRGRPVPSPPLAVSALDGKSVRGSFDGLEKRVHLLWLVSRESGLRSLGRPSRMVLEKSNENQGGHPDRSYRLAAVQHQSPSGRGDVS
jgi:hypothetical protein